MRVVGAFSAGKSRLLSAMLASAAPRSLHPVSSLDRQTTLPLTISYGQEASLCALSASGDVTQRLDHFPSRDDLARHPKWRGLRLSAPLPHLLTSQRVFGRGQEEGGVLSLSLIDTPGWNSGELAADQVVIAEAEAPAVIFVTTGRNMEAKDDRRELTALLERLEETIRERYADVAQVKLITVITHVGADPRVAQGGRPVEERAREFYAWLQETAEDVGYGVICASPPHLIDLEQMPAARQAEICAEVWRDLQSSFGDERPVQLRPPAPVDPRAVILKAFEGVSLAHLTPLQERLALLSSIERASQGTEQPLAGLSERTLAPHSTERRRAKIMEQLVKWQTGDPYPSAALESLLRTRAPLIAPLPSGYPLSRWWRESFSVEMNELLSTLNALQDATRTAADAISARPNAHEMAQQSAHLQRATAELVASYERARPYLPALSVSAPPEGFVNLLLTLFMIHQGRERLRAIIC